MAVRESCPPYLDASTIEEKAVETRGQANWTGVPVDPFAIASHLGIEVLIGSFEDDTTEGVLRCNDGQPQILVRLDSGLARQKFTLAHELGHYVLHWDSFSQRDEEFVDNDFQLYRRGSGPNLSNRVELRREIQANMFAAALLMPAEAVRARVDSSRSVCELADEFGVSEQAMRYRINDLDV